MRAGSVARKLEQTTQVSKLQMPLDMVAQAASEEKVSMQVYFDVVAKKEGFHFRALDGKTPYAPTDASIQFDFGMPADVERPGCSIFRAR